MQGKNFNISIQRAKYVVMDLVMVSVSFLLFDIFRYYFLGFQEIAGSSLMAFLKSTPVMLEQILIPVGSLGIFWLSGYYNRPYGKSRVSELVTTFNSILVVTLILYFGLLINDSSGVRLLDYEVVLVLFGLLFAFTYAGRWLLTTMTIWRLREGRWKYTTLIVGNSPKSREIYRQIKETGSVWAYDVAGFIRLDEESQVEDGQRTWGWSQISEVCKLHGIDQIILAPEHVSELTLMSRLEYLFPMGIPVKIAPDTLSYVTGMIRLNDILGIPFLDLTSPRISECEKNVKRTIDVVVSTLTMICLSPVLLCTAIGVKLSSAGPVLYFQERMGRGHKPFNIIKFRSMRTDAEADGPRLSSETDPRVTKFGRFMRKYRIDELPQFWNVLRGDMSLVGPRPEREYFIERILQKAPYYALIFQVRPGVTSWGMVQYGYASDITQMVSRSKHDLLYLNNMSLAMDLKILIYTVRTVLTGKGM